MTLPLGENDTLSRMMGPASWPLPTVKPTYLEGRGVRNGVKGGGGGGSAHEVVGGGDGALVDVDEGGKHGLRVGVDEYLENGLIVRGARACVHELHGVGLAVGEDRQARQAA